MHKPIVHVHEHDFVYRVFIIEVESCVTYNLSMFLRIYGMEMMNTAYSDVFANVARDHKCFHGVTMI